MYFLKCTRHHLAFDLFYQDLMDQQSRFKICRLRTAIPCQETRLLHQRLKTIRANNRVFAISNTELSCMYRRLQPLHQHSPTRRFGNLQENDQTRKRGSALCKCHAKTLAIHVRRQCIQVQCQNISTEIRNNNGYKNGPIIYQHLYDWPRRKIPAHVNKYTTYLENTLMTYSWYGHTARNNCKNIYSNYLNAFHQSIKFTYDISATEATFLDVTVYKGKRHEETQNPGLQNTFQTHQHNPEYLASSCHPAGVKKGIAIGECLRFLRNTSNKKEFEKQRDNLLEHLQNRGYPPVETKRLMDITTYGSRSEHLRDKGRRE